jgi:DNA-binding MarR family transcriptional regulator
MGDINYLRTLSSYSRITLLKKIKDKRLNLTDLSAELKLSKSTVHEHLQKLIESGFVTQTKNSPKSKWVFYELTEDGQALFNKERTTFVSGMIFSGLMSVGAVCFAAANFFRQASFGTSQTMESVAYDLKAAAPSNYSGAEPSALETFLTPDLFLILSIILFFAALATILYLFLYKRKK